MNRRIRAREIALAAAVLAAVVARPAAAAWPSQLTAVIGGTGVATGAYNEGGASIGVAALWTVETPVRFGLELTADDLGAHVGVLRDPNDGVALGSVENGHRQVLGAAWRLDADLPPRGRLLPFASAGWGIYHVADDARGDVLTTVNSVGFHLGGGVRTPFGGPHTLGVSFRYQRLFNDRTGRYLTFGVDWSWGARERP